MADQSNKKRGYNKKPTPQGGDQQYHRQYRSQQQQINNQQRIEDLLQNPITPKLNQVNFNAKTNQKSIFIKAKVTKVEEKTKELKTKEQNDPTQENQRQQDAEQTSHNVQKYLSVTLEQLFSNSTKKTYELKVFPASGIFHADIEDQKRAEHYKVFATAQARIANNEKVFVEILNAKIKVENKKQDKVNQQNENNEQEQQDQQNENKEKKMYTIHLTEWTQVQLIGSIFQFSDIKKIGEITANDRYVNILGLVTGHKFLDNITNHKNSALQTPPVKETEKAAYIQITVCDGTGSIHFVLPYIDKFAKRINLEKQQYLYFQKAQKQLSSLNEGESNVYLNIYITEKGEQSGNSTETEGIKQKGSIFDLTEDHQQEIEVIKSKQHTLANVSNKIWIVKTPQ